MKTNFQTQKMKLFLFLILLVTLLQSCTKDPDSSMGNGKTTYHYLTEAALNQTPYFTNPAFDTISFASDKGDTVSFVKIKTDSNWFCEKSSGSPDNQNMDCYQKLHITYNTIKGTGSFDVKYSYKTLDYGLFRIEILFNNFYFIICECIIDDKSYKNYKEKMIINSKTYNNTFFEYHNLVENNVATGYFNKDFGLFHLVDSLNNKNLYLIK